MNLLYYHLRPFFLILLVNLCSSEIKAQYSLANSPTDSLMSLDSFYISYTIETQKDSNSTLKIDTFIIAKYDTFLSYHAPNLDVITRGSSSLVVQHKTKRIIFGPKANKFFNRFYKIQLADTNQVISIDSTDTIYGYRVYLINYDTSSGWPYCLKEVKLNLNTGYVESIKLTSCGGKSVDYINHFKIINLQITGSINPPTPLSQFLNTVGLPSTWHVNPSYYSYKLINYY